MSPEREIIDKQQVLQLGIRLIRIQQPKFIWNPPISHFSDDLRAAAMQT